MTVLNDIFSHELQQIEKFKKLSILDLIKQAAADLRSAPEIFKFAWALEPFAVSFHHYNSTFLPAVFDGDSMLHKAIRGHAAEDDKHLEWYYDDLVFLNQDRKPHMINCPSARVVTGIEKLLSVMKSDGNDLGCLAAIESVEETGAVFFKECADASNAISDRNLKYFSQIHFDRETGSLLGTHTGYGLKEYLSEHDPTQDQIYRAMDAIDFVFKLFTQMLDDIACEA